MVTGEIAVCAISRAWSGEMFVQFYSFTRVVLLLLLTVACHAR